MFKDLPEGQTHYVGDNCNPPHSPLSMEKETERSKYWLTMVDILDGLYPKGDKGRGKAMVFLAYIEMMLNGVEFDEEGMPITKE
jgi:hypothetical protein